MNQSPLISICIPTYNGQKFIDQCLQSCINQSFSDYEIIIVDDGSTDNTISIIDSYCLKSDKIRFYKNEKNLGLVGNWNKCIELSQGKWIKFVFQDDYISYDCLQRFAEHITDTNQLIVSKRNFILEHDASPEDQQYYHHDVRTLENTGDFRSNEYSAKTISEISANNICLNFIGEPTLCLFRKSVIEDVGMVDSDFKQICDLEFFQRIATKYGLTYLPSQVCSFRIHNQSATSTNLISNIYRLSHVEPTLLVYKMLTHPSYQAYRNNLSKTQLFKINTFFKVRGHEAFLKSKQNDQDRLVFFEMALKLKNVDIFTAPNLFSTLVYDLIRIKRKVRN